MATPASLQGSQGALPAIGKLTGWYIAAAVLFILPCWIDSVDDWNDAADVRAHGENVPHMVAK